MLDRWQFPDVAAYWVGILGLLAAGYGDDKKIPADGRPAVRDTGVAQTKQP